MLRTLMNFGLILFLASGLINQAQAYSIKQFSCPIRIDLHLEYLKQNHPEVLNQSQTDFKPMWTRSVERNSVSDASRIQLVKNLYGKVEAELRKTGSLLTSAYSIIEANTQFSDFYSKYVEENAPKMKKNGVLKRKALRECRKEALAVVTGKSLDPVSTDLPTATLENTASNAAPSSANEVLEEFQEIIVTSCFAPHQTSLTFHSCLENISVATLMCAPPKERLEMKTTLDDAFEKFKAGVEKTAAKLGSLDTEENEHDRRLRSRSHREMRVLVNVFPRIFNEYVAGLNAEGRGDQFLKEISQNIAKGGFPDVETLSRADTVFQELVQFCRVDKALDNRKIMSTVMTAFGAAATVATVLIGPVFGLSLLPKIMNAGSTLGMLAAANSVSLAINAIDKTILMATFGESFKITKIAKLVYKHIHFEKQLFDQLFTSIKKYRSDKLSRQEEDEAKKVLIDAIKITEEYRRITELYVSIRRAKLLGGRQIISLVTLGMSILPTVSFNQALVEAIRTVPGTVPGMDAISSISRIQRSATGSALETTSTVVSLGNSTATEIFINEGRLPRLTDSQLYFLRDALNIFFNGGMLSSFNINPTGT